VLGPILGRGVATYSHALPTDTNYIKAHTLLFEMMSLGELTKSRLERVLTMGHELPIVHALLAVGLLFANTVAQSKHYISYDEVEHTSGISSDILKTVLC
jgi:hypothetical protein